MNALLPLLLCLSQAPQPAAVPTRLDPSRLDVVELKNGDQLTGRVTAELDGYVEIEVETGAVIGVSRAMVHQVRRGALLEPRTAALVKPDDAWFVLHDADGASVGWLHTAITNGSDGTFTVSEEYEFVCGQRRYQVTNLCTADADARGQTCYFRERVSEPTLSAQRLAIDDPLAAADRIVDERIVEATCNGAVLTIQHLDGNGRVERELPWAPNSTFPLLARTIARQTAVAIGPVPMFDPAREELVVRTIDGTGARQVVLDGQRQRVAEVTETTATGDNREWLDADLRTVRRELAGPALVAVPSSAESARSAVGVTSIPSAVVAEADGAFGLWVPNPAWLAVEPLPAGHLVLECAAHGAEIRLSRLDHLDPGTMLESAADAVAKWFVLLHPELQIDSRYTSQVRDREAIRLTAAGTRGRKPQRATIDVIPHADQFLVLICRAPIAVWDELAEDFAFVVQTVELDARALTPKLQGPLAETAGRNPQRRVTGPMPGPAPAPRVPKPQPVDNVRIPN